MNIFDSKKLGALLGILILGGVGSYFVQQRIESKEQMSKSALYKVQTTFDAELKAIPEAERTPGLKLDVDQKFSKTVSELNGMLAAKTLTDRVLFDASLKLGTLYLDYRQPEKASPVLKGATEFAKTAFQKATAFYLYAVALEQSSQFKEALDAFQKALNENTEGMKGELMFGVVRLSLKVGDAAKAKLISEKMNKDLPGTKATEAAAALLKDAK